MRKAVLLAGFVVGFGLFAGNRARAVEIEYWQYVFETRVKAMDQLIARFQNTNPGITVKQVTFPYADYQTRVIASHLAGHGPEVMQLFYGWLDKFAVGGILRPLPQEMFPHDRIEAEFFPIVSAMKRNQEYYGLPTAVRSLALFYNKKLFTEAGLDPDKPPKTLEDFVAAAEKIVKRDAVGNLIVVGSTLDMTGQDHHWWREVLIRQFGGVPYTANDTQVAYASDAGRKALAFYINLQREKKIGQIGFLDEGQAAFRGGKAGMTIDGTFRLGAFKSIKDFEWGVAELPASSEGLRSNYASYFANGISAKAKGEKLDASVKFLAYLTSPEAMELWLTTVGELPARRAVALTGANLKDPIFGPFLKGLEEAHTTQFKDEAAQRQNAIDMVNRVLLEQQPIEASLKQAAEIEQKVLDAAKP